MNDDRLDDMINRRVLGETLEAIGNSHGVSRQRVQQILAGHQDEILERKREHRYGLYKRYLEGETLEALDREFGWAKGTLRRYCHRQEWPMVNRLRIGPGSIKPEAGEHGTINMYRGFGCRCEKCRAANNAYQRRLYGREPREHGTQSAYTNYKCRCDACKKAGSIQNRRTRLRRKIREAQAREAQV